jgi:hypothetical protein
MPSWTRADLMEQSGAPDAQGRPFAYVTHQGSDAVNRVLYRGGDAHIHELRLEDDRWKQADLSAQAGSPDAAGHPFAYETSIDSDPIPRVIYRGQSGDVIELRLDGGSWKKADLSQLVESPGAQGTLCAGVTGAEGASVARVIYRADDDHVYEVRLEDGSWKKADLSALAGAPAAVGDPFLSITRDGSEQTARVVYLGADARIHEVRLEAGNSWKKADLTAQSDAPDAASGPFAYIPDAHPRVNYRGADGHVHELRLEGGAWKKADLTALADAEDAQGQPSAYGSSDESGSIPRVIHRGGEGRIIELRLEGGSWKKADLTNLAGAPPAAGDPIGYLSSSDPGPIPRVLYRDGDNHLQELRLE